MKIREFVDELHRRGGLPDDGHLTFLEFYGHAGNCDIPLVPQEFMEFEENPEEREAAEKVRSALLDLRYRMSPDSVVKLAGCSIASTRPEYCQLLAEWLGCTVIANDDTVAVTGKGLWWKFRPNQYPVVDNDGWNAPSIAQGVTKLQSKVGLGAKPYPSMGAKSGRTKTIKQLYEAED